MRPRGKAMISQAMGIRLPTPLARDPELAQRPPAPYPGKRDQPRRVGPGGLGLTGVQVRSAGQEAVGADSALCSKRRGAVAVDLERVSEMLADAGPAELVQRQDLPLCSPGASAGMTKRSQTGMLNWSPDRLP